MPREVFVWDARQQKVVPKGDTVNDHVRRVEIMRDLEPYRAAAADKATGTRPTIGGRRQHREFLARNGYVELGTAEPRNNLQLGPRRGEIARDIKRALGE